MPNRMTSIFVLFVAACMMDRSAYAQSPEKRTPSDLRPASFELAEVPDGDINRIVEYMDRMTARRRELVTAFRQSMTQTYQAEIDAAQKVLEQSDNVDDRVFLRAASIAIDRRVHAAATANREEQARTFELVARQAKLLLDSDANPSDLVNAARLSQHLEEFGPTDLAIEANEFFARLFQSSGKASLIKQAQSFDAAARRLSLLGEPLEIHGDLINGGSLEWSDYLGKTVLVALWSSNSDATIKELDRLRLTYECYRDAGFDIVAVCSGPDYATVDAFLSGNLPPWNVVFDRAGLSDSWTSRLGVSQTPAWILLDDQGIVVSVKATGPELSRLLRERYGPETVSARGDAIQGNWAKAATKLTRLARIEPSAAKYRIGVGAALLRSEDPGAYRNVCQRAMKDFEGETSPFALASIVQLCTLAEDSGVEPERLRAMASVARSKSGNNAIKLAKGMAHFRAGDFAACLQELPQSGDPQQQAMAGYFRAMAAFQMDRNQEADAWLAEADDIAERFFSDLKGERHGEWMLDHWISCAIVQKLREEAHQIEQE